MRFLSISINLLEFFRIMSFVFDLKYLSQNLINFNMLGVFWNPQDAQFPKLSLDLHFEQHLKEILRIQTAEGYGGHHCMTGILQYFHFFPYCFFLKPHCIPLPEETELLPICPASSLQHLLISGENNYVYSGQFQFLL